MDDQVRKTLKTRTDIGPMFDSIAWRYDFLNHLLSFGIDRYWRRKAVGKISESCKNPGIIDVATGTGDLAIEAVKLNPVKITGIDISENMLEIGRQKIKARNLEDIIEFIKCDSENICFEDNTFDAAMVAFGVRNFRDPVKGLSEMRRVVRNGGIVVVLEFSKPDGFIFKHVYNFYFRYFLPFIGALFSRRRKAYKYLNESVMNFADKEKFIQMMRESGLSEIKQTRLTRGIASIYTAVKK
ncbi:MAG: bifunctional demethylmenaquinone methyltransferase/2-methoxy-6-polyprenyl-1,4-benzoquinol methylase UbiE [Bacteroidia bacterium]|nr:bifunctional demethylmenaquinone methyltransferase/2-methoxy-6-polyprenyl-1,4-benzoquinol methylase UbiE [Bacteroidia bacterium]